MKHFGGWAKSEEITESFPICPLDFDLQWNANEIFASVLLKIHLLDLLLCTEREGGGGTKGGKGGEDRSSFPLSRGEKSTHRYDG